MQDFEKLLEQSKAQYPVIDQDIKAFNAVSTDNQKYLEYLNFINTSPLPILNNQTGD